MTFSGNFRTITGIRYGFSGSCFPTGRSGHRKRAAKAGRVKNRINAINKRIPRCSAVGSRPVWAGPASAASGGFSAAGPGAAVADFERFFRDEGSGHRKRATKAERVKNRINAINKRISRCSAVGSAPALGAGCRRFESCHLDQTKSPGTRMNAGFSRAVILPKAEYTPLFTPTRFKKTPGAGILPPVSGLSLCL